MGLVPAYALLAWLAAAAFAGAAKSPAPFSPPVPPSPTVRTAPPAPPVRSSPPGMRSPPRPGLSVRPPPLPLPPQRLPSPPVQRPPPAPAPRPPPASVPEVYSVPAGAIPADADVGSFLADARDNLYLPGPLVRGNNGPVSFTNWQLAQQQWQATRANNIPYNVTCTMTATYYQLCSNGTLLRTFNDTAEFGFTADFIPYASYDPQAPTCYSTTPNAAAVDADGQHLYWAAVFDVQGALMKDPILLVRRINLRSGVADTVGQASLTQDWIANNTDDPRRILRTRAFIATGLAGAAFLPSIPPQLALFFRASAATPASVTFAPVECRIHLDSGAAHVREVGLGIPMSSWVYGDDFSNSTTDLYLAYTDSLPASPALCDPVATSGALCYSHFLARAASSNGAAAAGSRAAVQEVLRFEVFLPMVDMSGTLYSSYYTYTRPPITLARNRRAEGAASSSLYLADAYSCQIKRLDSAGSATLLAGYANLASLTGMDGDDVLNITGSNNEGASSGRARGVRARPVCSKLTDDGPSVGRPIGQPTRLVRGSTGTLFFAELVAGAGYSEYTIRRLTGI